MDKQQLIEHLRSGGFEISDEFRMEHGSRIRLATGAIVCLYDTGKIVVQGRNQEPVKALLSIEFASAARRAASTPVASREVFVVYGHDGPARTELEAMLRRWKLEPLILDQLPSAGQTIIEKLESVRKEATFAVVLATPDDEGHRAGHDDEKSFRARQNVVLELGMMLALLGRPRVAILLKNQVKMERPSDIQGLIYIPFKDSIKETALQLAKEINGQGIPINLSKI